jgi:putative oxidoreductase
MSLQSSLARWEPYAHGILRILTGLLFLEHGAQKFLSFPAGRMSGSGWALASAGAYGGIIELIAGILITIGWFTRSAAFIASGEMAVAYWMVHAQTDFFPVNNMGDAAVLFCFIFLYFVFAGPGAFSIDGQQSYVEVTDAERR